MFVRTSNSGHEIKWKPDDKEAAEQAMQDVVDRFDSWNGSRYSLESETAEKVLNRYDELVGGDDDE